MSSGAAERVQERVADLAFGDLVLELVDPRVDAPVIGGQDVDRQGVLDDQRADRGRRLGRQLVVGVLTVRQDVAAQRGLLFTGQLPDEARVADLVGDRRGVRFDSHRKDRDEREGHAGTGQQRRGGTSAATVGHDRGERRPRAPASTTHQVLGRPYSSRSA